MKKEILLVITLLLSCKIYSQTPSNDKNWILNTNKSDEFNNSTLDNSKWEIYQKNYPCDLSDYITFDGNNLILRTDIEGNDYCAGSIKSITADYSYGFFEIIATIPKGKGFWTAFWLFASKYDPWPDKLLWYEEIDILEPNGCQSINANINEVGIWEKDGENSIKKYAKYELDGLPDLSASSHRFAVEWLPNYIVFYFNGVPFNKFCNHFSIPTNPMSVIFSQGFSSSPCDPDANTIAILPEYFKINYFRYYELKCDCEAVETITSSSELQNFDHSLKKKIIIENAASIIKTSSETTTTLRATDEVTISSQFEVSIGSELNIVTHSCPE